MRLAPHLADRQLSRPAHVQGWVRSVWNALTGVVGAVVGLAPHVLHHIGLLAGTALVAGSGGTVVFGVLGLVASLPLLNRLHRRFGTWRAPALGLAAFVVMFALSAFVIGPEISGQSGDPAVPGVEHDEHDTHEETDG